MKKVPLHQQFAALPYRRGTAGELEILLITSRETQRWIVPKGWPSPGLAPHEAAAREALEEAGVVGRIDQHPLGSYRYQKNLPDGTSVSCEVEVFALEIERQLDTWKEQDERNAQWLEVSMAADTVEEPELRQIIRSLANIT